MKGFYLPQKDITVNKVLFINSLSQFKQNLVESIHCWREFKFIQTEDRAQPEREIKKLNSQKKTHWLRISLTTFGKKLKWVMRPMSLMSFIGCIMKLSYCYAKSSIISSYHKRWNSFSVCLSFGLTSSVVLCNIANLYNIRTAFGHEYPPPSHLLHNLTYDHHSHQIYKTNMYRYIHVCTENAFFGLLVSWYL